MQERLQEEEIVQDRLMENDDGGRIPERTEFQSGLERDGEMTQSRGMDFDY